MYDIDTVRNSIPYFADKYKKYKSVSRESQGVPTREMVTVDGSHHSDAIMTVS